MIIPLNEDVSRGLALVSSFGIEGLRHLCNIFINTLRNGESEEHFADLKTKLSRAEVEDCISAIGYFLTECAKVDIKKRDFGMSLSDVTMAEGEKRALYEFYVKNMEEIRSLLSTSTDVLRYPRFGSLEWRLDAQIASRSVQHIAEPYYILRFNLKTGEGSETKSHDLQLEYSDLVHLTDELNNALSEFRNKHINRTMRHIV